MSESGSVFSENDNKFYVDNLIDPYVEDRLKSLGTSWLKVTSWLLQEDLYWPKLDKNNQVVFQ